MSGLIDLKAMELHFEAANDGGNLAERGMGMAVTGAIKAGEELLAAKALIPHGEWEEHRAKNWLYGKDTAQRYMKIAAKTARVPFLKDASSIREALRMIAAEKAESEPVTAQRAERKTGQVEVVEPGQQSVQADEKDDDPTPDPPSIRKTAKGTEKVKEANKPKPAAITPEILDEPEESDPFAYATFTTCLEIAETKVDKADPVACKGAAKIARKLADKFDPPKKFTKPDGNDVAAYMTTLPDATGRDVAKAADGIIDHYESNGWMVGKVKMQDWKATARKWLKNQDQFTGGSNGKRTATTGTGHSRPPVERAKINYK